MAGIDPQQPRLSLIKRGRCRISAKFSNVINIFVGLILLQHIFSLNDGQLSGFEVSHREYSHSKKTGSARGYGLSSYFGNNWFIVHGRRALEYPPNTIQQDQTPVQT